MHVKFAAAVTHEGGALTRFLALSKCLPNQDFLQVFEIARRDGLDEGAAVSLHYDAEWLAVLKATAHLQSFQRGRLNLSKDALMAASDGRSDFSVTEEDEQRVRQMSSLPDLAVPLNFERTVAVYQTGEAIHGSQAPLVENPQTIEFVAKFGLPADFRSQRGATQGMGASTSTGSRGEYNSRRPGMQLPAPVNQLPASAMQLPEPVSSSWPAQPFAPMPTAPSADPASYAAQAASAAHRTGILDSVVVPPLDEEIDLDDD